MTLTGSKLVGALVGASLLGAVAGITVEGWRKVRGLPSLECSADAGVQVVVDAGVSSKADCAASIEHWNTITVPGPTRYVYVDGGVQTEVQTVTVLVPDVRLSGATASSSSVGAEAEATASSHVLVAPSEPERHWEAGPVALYGFSGHQVLWGAQAGWGGGPFYIHGQALKGPGDVYAGVSVGWRW